MKKIFLFLVALLCFTQVFSETKTINLAITLGKTVRLTPWTDYGPKGSSNSAYHTLTSSVENGLKVSSEFIGNYCYAFDITALKKGEYLFENTISYRITDYQTTSCKMMYNITVVEVESITIPSSLNLKKGDTYKFLPIITHPNAETTLQWTSLNPNVAEIDADGNVITKQVGTAIITCTADNGVSASCSVTVTPVIATDIMLNHDEYELELGEEAPS